MTAHDVAGGSARLLNSIRSRRSFKLKDLDPDPIDLDLIGEMLEAANWAPSHGKTEPWRFVVFSGDQRSTISEAFGHAYRALNPGAAFSGEAQTAQERKPWMAPVWIALGVDPDPARPEWEELIAFGCAVHNAQLVASALRLGSKWTSGAVVTHPLVAAAVGFGPATQLRGFLYVGRPVGEWPTSARRPISEKVRWMSTERSSPETQ